jgi:cytohesin
VTTDLHWLAESEQLDRLRQALADGADVSARDDEGRTPLHVAVANGRAAAVDVLLDAGADPEAPVASPPGSRPLHLACLPPEPGADGDPKLVDRLLRAGVDADAADERGTTPLHLCAGWCDADLVERLVGRGARVGASDRNGRTPLHVAVRRGAPPDPDVLLGAEDGPVPTVHARRAGDALARLEDVAVVEVLLVEGADPNAADRTGITPLHVAAECGNTWAVRALLAHGATPSPRDEWQSTPLHLAADPAIVDALLDAGADREARDRDQATPLHRAVGAGRSEAVERLVAAGADLLAVDGEGRTPLHLAAAAGRGLTVDLLLDEGADPRARDGDGLTPLDLATAAGHDHAVAALKHKRGGWRRRLPFLGRGDE